MEKMDNKLSYYYSCVILNRFSIHEKIQHNNYSTHFN